MNSDDINRLFESSGSDGDDSNLDGLIPALDCYYWIFERFLIKSGDSDLALVLTEGFFSFIMENAQSSM